MLKVRQINNEQELTDISRDDIINFLYAHLDRFRDDKVSIGKCLDYAFKINGGTGGFVLAGYVDGRLAGIVIMNKTGMQGFIPENVLVYIAVDADMRGKGIGKRLIEEVINRVDGDIKLHVEYDNPAKNLYERAGFTNKYAEMRFTKNK
ncbi:MAG: GNAT family N-acetyltransferase [Bacteroidales bacterium]|nr:GNAT family N-acetyltransferase [Bacteroidales bacterium]MDD4672979.1 GNAT family N-acetyltransferase [Bacteroidales bacterium]MDY0348508.1 GNAT family N-acetyltransferase [Tenuifilaceae bacterium]